MVSHVCGPCSNPRCCCDSHPSLRAQVVASDTPYEKQFRKCIYWVELYSAEEVIFVVPDDALVDLYVHIWIQVKALVTDEAAARALEQLVLYVQGFDPAQADQEILYPVEVRPPEFVNGHLHYHQIICHPVWGHFD
eukprot:scaffold69384_cov30-Attheya_sp.AAC.2